MNLISPVVQRWIHDAKDDPDAFWSRAAEQLPWLRRWDRVFEWTPPTFRWFIGGQTNLAYSALDHHVKHGWGGHAALVYLSERGERQVFTYAKLLHEVERLAAALRGMGIEKGDRITIYMPTCAEAIMLMLATARIGAIHVVVFAGFGAQALGDRVQASGSRLIFTTDITYRKGKNVQIKEIVDASLANGNGSVEHVIILNRANEPVPMQTERDITWQDFLTRAQGHSGSYVPMEANEPAFILATSGTTSKPKLTIHTHGGYQVHIHSMGQWVYGLKPTDVWWSTSDIGWIVGHSYIVYAPLIAGATTLAFEGALDYPSPDTLWQVVEEFGVTSFFTSPTAARMLMKYGTEPTTQYNHSSLERVFCAGEVLNAPAWEWLQGTVLQNRIPVLDHMWQTETGGPILGNPYGLGMLPIKPGSATIPLPGIEAKVVTPGDGSPVAPNEKGIMVITRPFPGLTPALWGEPERYARDYWQILPGMYYTGDSAQVDDDGYVWFAGRADEIIKIAGHRIGAIEVETAFLKHPSVAESGVVGRPDELRGEVIAAFVVLKQGHQLTEDLQKELVAAVRNELGPVVVVGEINIVASLPKTRSGKIMRRVLRSVTLDLEPGDISTIEEESSVEEARHAWHQLKKEIAR
jgi:acetyl-CoA synthetase